MTDRKLLEQYLSGKLSEEEFLLQEGIMDTFAKVKKKIIAGVQKIKNKIKSKPIAASAILLFILTVLVYKKYSPQLASALQKNIQQKKLILSLLKGDFSDVKNLSKEMDALTYSLATGKEAKLRNKIVDDVKSEGLKVSQVMSEFAKARERLVRSIKAEGGSAHDIEKEVSRKFNQLMIDSGILKIVALDIPVYQGVLTFKRLASVRIPTEDIKPVVIKLVKNGITGKRGEIKPGAVEALTPDMLGRDKVHFDKVISALVQAIGQATGKTIKSKSTRVRKGSVPTGEPTKSGVFRDVGPEPDIFSPGGM